MAVRNSKGRMEIRLPEVDELPEAGALQVAGRATQFQPGHKKSVGRKPGMAKLGIPVAQCNPSDPRYRSLLRNAGTYRRHRTAELARIHGYVSAGAAAMIASASLSLASSKWMYILAMEAPDADTRIKATGMASRLATDARQLEVAAWEIAAREAAAYKATQAGVILPPWLTNKKPEEIKP